MSYRSAQIEAADGTEIVAPPAAPRRYKHAALDVVSLPVVACTAHKSVELGGHTIPLHYGYRRWAWRSERCVEIALGAKALSNYDAEEVLEVGNVLPMANFVGHTVVDKYERGPGVINEDIVGFNPGRRFDLAISISTIEHVGWDELPQDPRKAAVALDAISELADDLLVTVPVGHHLALQDDFVNGGIFDEVTLIVRESRVPKWRRRPIADMSSLEYGRPLPFANGILVGLRGDPLSTRR
jgi:hypothetical protein